jgi:hypothetical protein
MLSVNTLIEFIKELRGTISEPARSEVAHRLGNLISDILKVDKPDTYNTWIIKDRLKFFRACELINPEKWVPDELHVETTKLAEFCNRWLACNLFKLRNDPTAEWRPITPEQNSLRVTMIEELQALDKD